MAGMVSLKDLVSSMLRVERASATPERPLRGAILSKDLLASRAVELADYFSHVERGGRGAMLRPRFRDNCRVLTGAYFAFAESARVKEPLGAGAEWLLDNFHVIDEQVRDIRRDLPRSYYKALPKLTEGEWAGFPRVYRLVCEFISHTDSIVDIESLTTFVQAYQTRCELLIGEVWAVPIMLRLAIVENLRRLAESGLAASVQRRLAERLCKEVIEVPGMSGTDLLMALVQWVKRNPTVLDYGAGYILRRLRARGGPASLSAQWVDEQLRERGIDPSQVDREEQQRQAADQLSVGNAVTALKTIGSLNWRTWFESVSSVDSVLAQDPSGIYRASDFVSRDLCRHTVEQLARWTRRSESEVAAAAVACAKEYIPKADGDVRPRHVGYYLVDDGVPELEGRLKLRPPLLEQGLRLAKSQALLLYLGGIAAFTLLGMLVAFEYSARHGGGFGWQLVLMLLLPLPLSEVAILVVQWFATKFVAPKPICKLDFEEGVPATAATAVTVQTIVSDRDAVDRVFESLEIRAIGNREPNIAFGVLMDLADAPTEVLSGDIGIINRAKEVVRELNERYCSGGPERFFVMIRSRLWNESEGRFIGWERKRGKISEFNRFLRGADRTTFSTIVGDVAFLRTVKYVITLDNDTQLPPGSAQKLIGAIAHPLNRAIFDERTGIVTKGYSILQPRVGITLQSAHSSRFAAIYSGHTGLDPYTRTVSDVYQDLFAEGSYIGKGVYDVDAFEKALHNRFPDNSLLSHDLIEGLFARCGLVSDIEVFDEFPMRYHAQAKRQHRWMRGDWQTLPWLGSRIPDVERALYPSPISLLGRWKLFDNLRRSLVPASLFLLLVAIFAFAPGSLCFWMVGVLVMIGFPIYSLFWRFVVDLPIGYSVTAFLSSFWSDLYRSILLIGTSLALLPHQALLGVDAMRTSLRRMYVTKKKLLEWQTAADAERRSGGDLASFVDALRDSWKLSLLALAVVLLVSPSALLNVPSIFFFLWFSAPYVAWAISRPIGRSSRGLDENETAYLREVAYRTWRYFDSFLIPKYNSLIPDNLQLVPERVVAERTSPTNISLSVMSVLSAYDLGFIPLIGALERVERTFSTLSSMERFHGHFLNWYSITDLRPLAPRYISTVDSGNLVGHFIAVREALLPGAHLPFVNDSHISHFRLLAARSGIYPELAADARVTSVKNLQDLARFSAEVRASAEAAKSKPVEDEFRRALQEFETLEVLVEWVHALPLLRRLGERGMLPKQLKSVDRILTGRVPTMSLVQKVVNRLLKVESAVSTADLKDEEAAEFQQLVVALQAARERVIALETSRQFICNIAEHIVRETDFGFLFDGSKKLFVIGYNIDNGHKDNSYYDLLASEARLASIVAIAKGDLPQTHWFLLSRALTDTPGGKALLSWAGTMFEYLMPLLVTKDFPGTLLSETYQAVVRAQRAYGRRRGVPWGISESAYSGVDFEKTYQYKAFGVPGLGLKRGLAEDLVVSPYSTLMAVGIDPVRSVQNLRRLEADGLRGEFGFYEAVDYTPDRLGAEERSHVVKSFLAHHQGMSLVSINNLLNNDIFRERFHSNPAIKSIELLLQERFPTRIPIIYPHQAEVFAMRGPTMETRAELTEQLSSPHTVHPITRLLSNGRYSIIIDNSGVGTSTFESNIALDRARDDGVTSNLGQHIYLREIGGEGFWSAAYEPSRTEPEFYESIFNPDKVEFRRRDRGITTLTEITVSPEDDVEVRRVTVTNLSQRRRELEITSFAEIALANRRADGAHPAFSKMFIESEYIEEYEVIILRRKPRTEHDSELYLMHLAVTPVVWAPVQFETSRDEFIGRGGSLRSPAAMGMGSKLSGTVGTVLDPIVSIRQRMELEVGESHTLSFVTGVARSREEVLDLVRKYREGARITRAFEMAWSHSHVAIRHQQFSLSSIQDFQRLANAIVHNFAHLRAPSEVIKRCKMPQSALWRFGISGDEAIVLVVISDPEQLKFAQELLLAHEYLRQRGVRFDLVLLNDYASGYLQELQNELEFMVKTGFSRNMMDQPGGVYLRSTQQLSADEVNLLHATARVILYGSGGTLNSQLLLDTKSERPPVVRAKTSKGSEKKLLAADPIEFWNGVGGFVDSGATYSVMVQEGKLPPLPWANVVANEKFGFLVTERGAGFTWFGNSRENRLTPWSNDPVTDPHGEVVYIRDQESGEVWCPTGAPTPSPTSVRASHGFGYSRFSTSYSGVSSELTLSGALEDPVKWYQVELTNNSATERRLELYFYVEWVLGFSREQSYRHVRTGWDGDREFLFASNPFGLDFPDQVAFIGSNLQIQSYTANRREFVGRHRGLGNPAVFEPGAASQGKARAGSRSSGLALSGAVGAGFEPVGVIKVQRTLQPGERCPVLFYLAQADSLPQAQEKAAGYRSLTGRSAAFTAVTNFWSDTLNSVQVKTPNRAFDIMSNGWLLYQTLACRMLARSGFFQSSGAIGFRDQLQDSLALLFSRPELTRKQILLHAERQFVEGDVQHWWHPPSGRGIRTRISDNYLWLPFVTAQYLQVTGDYSILDEVVPFIDGPQLEPNQGDSYFTPQRSSQSASLYEHCLRSLDRSFPVGVHGLPFIGHGDWNDGMNAVGEKGLGESVWLGWFIGDIMNRFAEVVEKRDDRPRAERYRAKAVELAASIERHAWDGKWYHRAYCDDGTPLGTANADECQIDSLAQSWSVITGLGDPLRRRTALDSVYERLVDREHREILLLTPAFQKHVPNPGYIQSYPPGLRENGGQYTHAAAWVVIAAAVAGDGDRAVELFDMINPITHSKDERGVHVYKTEPYAMCGDVYSNPQHQGRGGWSWYTGSSGWLYRAAVQFICGLHVEADSFTVDPSIPSSWAEYSIVYRRHGSTFTISVRNPKGVQRGVERIEVDGKAIEGNRIFFANYDGAVSVTVTLGGA